MHPHKITDLVIAPANPFAPGASSLDFLLLTGAVLAAVAFTAYLLRCYLQELRQRRRVRRRQQLARANYDPRSLGPLCLAGPQTPPQASEPRASDGKLILSKKLDAWALQWLMPEHERIAIVWDHPADPDAPRPSALYLDPASPISGTLPAANTLPLHEIPDSPRL